MGRQKNIHIIYPSQRVGGYTYINIRSKRRAEGRIYYLRFTACRPIYINIRSERMGRRENILFTPHSVSADIYKHTLRAHGPPGEYIIYPSQRVGRHIVVYAQSAWAETIIYYSPFTACRPIYINIRTERMGRSGNILITVHSVLADIYQHALTAHGPKR